MDNLRIVVGPEAPELERYAATELQRYLRMLFGATVPVTDDASGTAPLVLIGSPNTNPAIARDRLGHGWPSISAQGIVLKGTVAQGTWAVGGGSPVATMWAAYELVERLGVRYLLSGDVFPDDPGPLSLPELDEHIEPVFTERIWRFMNDEPHGPEMWSLDECRRVIDQLAKMKMSGIFFLTYPSHPFVHYDFRGVAKSTGVLDFGFRYPIDDDTIGRELFGEVDEFTNPEFRHCTSYEEMVEAGQRYARAVFGHARSRGMRTGFGFSLTNVTDEFKDRLHQWAPESSDEPAGDGGAYVRFSRLSMGATPRNRSFQNVDNPLLAELAEEIVRAHLQTYPEIDFIEIGSDEFPASAANHGQCWRTLDEKYDIESVAPLKTLEEQARSRDYHGQGRAERELKANIEFLYFVDKIFTEGKLLERLGRTNVEVLLSSVTEEMYPILGRVLPGNFGIGAMLDYNLSLALARIDRISSLADAGFGKYVTLSVQDDMNSLLVASEGTRIERFLEIMRRSAFKGWKSRYWSIGDLDHTTAFLARASWDASLTLNAAYDDYIRHVFGKDCLPEMRDALRVLEENSEFQGTEIFAVGFPYPSLMQRHFEMQGGLSGREGPRAELLKGRDTYTGLVKMLEAALPRCRPQGRGHLDYMIGRAKTCALFLETAHTVERAGFAQRAAEQAREDRDPEALRRKLNETAALLKRALGLARETIHAHIEIVRDESDVGLLAAMNQYMYKYIKARSYLATHEASCWHL
jgi:hypothetical protein